MEALLVLKGFGQSVSECVRGQRSLSALLKLAKYTLRKEMRHVKMFTLLIVYIMVLNSLVEIENDTLTDSMFLVR